MIGEPMDAVRLLVAVATVLLASAVFSHVAVAYRLHGRLTRSAASLQVVLFGILATASYLFVDGRPWTVDASRPTFPLAVALVAVGGLLLVGAMRRLGWSTSSGREAGSLLTVDGYRYSRNPQVLGYLGLATGYTLFWPSVWGATWLAVVAFVCHRMVLAEEDHLGRVFGEQYARYLAGTPRYLGLPRR